MKHLTPTLLILTTACMSSIRGTVLRTYTPQGEQHQIVVAAWEEKPPCDFEIIAAFEQTADDIEEAKEYAREVGGDVVAYKGDEIRRGGSMIMSNGFGGAFVVPSSYRTTHWVVLRYTDRSCAGEVLQPERASK